MSTPDTAELDNTVWKALSFQFPLESVAHETPGGHGGFRAFICLIAQSAMGAPGVICGAEDDTPPQPGKKARPAQIA
jgi:hypothetical protein